MRALRGLDAWVVVAPSAGVNVWCAAAGGLLTTSHVVTALKTSGVEAEVEHRRAVLPQLAATGVVARDVARRSGWKLRFGPVYAADIPRYLARGSDKSEDMRRVRFGAAERMEMAAAWALPILAVAVVASLWLKPGWVTALTVEVVVLAVAAFFTYDRIPWPRLAIFWAAAVGVSVAAAPAFGPAWTAPAAALSATLIVALLTFDFDGSTPVEGGSHFESKRWHITLDPQRCLGVFNCLAVCPEACFDATDPARGRKAVLAHSERCVKCGACVVQCPRDALFFTDAEGARIEPQSIRRYKLNLLGARGVDTGA